jgi:hypothetical protein
MDANPTCYAHFQLAITGPVPLNRLELHPELQLDHIPCFRRRLAGRHTQSELRICHQMIRRGRLSSDFEPTVPATAPRALRALSCSWRYACMVLP